MMDDLVEVCASCGRESCPHGISMCVNGALGRVGVVHVHPAVLKDPVLVQAMFRNAVAPDNEPDVESVTLEIHDSILETQED